MDLTDQRIPYDPFDEAEKPNDFANLDVVWASTQSPGNQIMNRMLRDAHNAKRKRQSMITQNKTENWLFQGDTIAKIPTKSVANGASNMHNSTARSNPEASASSAAPPPRTRAHHRRRPHSFGHHLREPPPEPERCNYEGLNPSLQAQGSTQLARDRLANIIKSVRESLDVRTLQRADSFNDSEGSDHTHPTEPSDATPDLIPTPPDISRTSESEESRVFSRHNSWAVQPAPLLSTQSLGEIGSTQETSLRPSQSLAEFQQPTTQNAMIALPDQPFQDPPVQEIPAATQQRHSYSTRAGAATAPQKPPAARRPLGMRAHQSLTNQTASTTSASGSGRRFRPPLASSKVVPNIANGVNSHTTSRRLVTYPKADVELLGANGGNASANSFGYNNAGRPSHHAKASSNQPFHLPHQPHVIRHGSDPMSAFPPSQRFHPRAGSPCPPSRTRRANQNQKLAGEFTRQVSATIYRETSNPNHDVVEPDHDLEFNPPNPFSQTNSIVELTRRDIELDGDGEGGGRHDEDEDEKDCVTTAIPNPDKSDSSFGPMDIDFDELEKVCSQYDRR